MDNDYTFNMASLEIIVAMIGAFILGALLCYLLRLLGLCCRRKKIPEETVSATAGAAASVDNEFVDSQPGISIPPVPVIDTTPKEMPAPPTPVQDINTNGNRLSVTGGAYEADIDSLLRGSGSVDSGAVALPETNTGNSSFESRVRESLASTASPIQPDIAASLDFPDDDHVDDLKKLEGIGPRIEKLLNDAGIKSYARLATMERDRLRDILQAGGREFTMHEPKSWPYQAELAAKQNWDRLREYQEFLLEGRDN